MATGEDGNERPRRVSRSPGIRPHRARLVEEERVPFEFGAVLRRSNNHRGYARSLFYRALRDLAPEAMESLERVALPLATKENKRPFASAPHEEWPDVEPLGPVVAAWARRQRLDAPWVVANAIDYVLALSHGDLAEPDNRHIHPEAKWAGTPIRGADYTVIVGTIKIDVPSFVWETGFQSRAEVERYLRVQFEAEMKHQLDYWEKLARALGFSELDKPKLERDVRRVVMRHVLARSVSDILRAEGDKTFDPMHPDHDKFVAKQVSAERAARTAIQRACELLDLPPMEGGRPRKRRWRAVKVSSHGN